MLGVLVAATMFAPLRYRWVYLQTNFFRPEAVDAAIALVHRSAKAGYNGIVYVDSKVQSQSPFPKFYADAVKRFLSAADSDHVEVIPGVLPVGWADGMLHLDPSLVESLPCRHVRMTVSKGQLVPDAHEIYPNGDFSETKGDAVVGATFQDAPGKATFIDRTVEFSGHPSLRIDNPKNASDSNGNCRLVKELKLEPFHQYRLSCHIKTESFEKASEFRVIALNPQGANTSFQDLGVQATQDWTAHTVVFNTLSNSDMKLYIGVWGGTTGKLWLSSLSLRDAGFLNVDRRPLCPVKLTNLSGQLVVEGHDVAKIADPQFGNVPYNGEFDFAHPIPDAGVPAGSVLKEGDAVFADYYAAASTESGKTSICLADPATAKQEAEEIDRVQGLFHPAGYFLCQDEMRVQGWCGACENSGKTAAQLLADDISRSTRDLHGKQAYVWSDMFDPFHNAVSNYYLVNGSLEGSWKGLLPGTVIVNWNSGQAAKSLKFFHEKGFDQILAGYYDAPVEGIKPWLQTAQSIGGVKGVMYTTWVNNYNDLEAFAKAAWGE